MDILGQMAAAVDRTRAIPLSTQLYDCLRAFIEQGLYPPGAVLPPQQQVAACTGVSEIVARRAFRRLAREGYVISRRHVGSVVQGGKTRWRGHVLLISTEMPDNYFNGTVIGILRAGLVQKGYLVSCVNVAGESDLPVLDLFLSQPLSLAVVFSDTLGIGGHVASADVPCMVVGRLLRPTPRLAAHISFSNSSAVEAFCVHCVRAGVKRVTEVTMDDAKPVCAPRLRKTGVPCDIWKATGYAGAKSMYEFVQRGVMQEVERRLSAQGRKCLPEVFFIGDDFAAAGALSALDHFGISIPEDVRFVSWSTAGTGPFYRKSLTRFEVDPVNEGRRLLDEVTGFLDGRGLPPDMAVDIKYVIGESFPE